MNVNQACNPYMMERSSWDNSGQHSTNTPISAHAVPSPFLLNLYARPHSPS